MLSTFLALNRLSFSKASVNSLCAAFIADSCVAFILAISSPKLFNSSSYDVKDCFLPRSFPSIVRSILVFIFCISAERSLIMFANFSSALFFSSSAFCISFSIFFTDRVISFSNSLAMALLIVPTAEAKSADALNVSLFNESLPAFAAFNTFCTIFTAVNVAIAAAMPHIAPTNCHGLPSP